jgi:hypothetical protein
MLDSLSADDRHGSRSESRGRRLARHAIVAWLLLLQPLALALTLNRALPRMATFGATAWVLIAARVALASAGIAIARRLRAHESDAWRAVAVWACAAIGVTLLERAWPELPTSLAPSEARLAALAAIARDALLAGVAVWLARAGTAVAGNGARGRESS